jgi:hypothetical protein
MRRAPFVPTILMAVAAVLYLGVPAEALLGFPLDPTRAYLSELAAVDQPTSGLFRALDFLAGGMVVLGSLLLLCEREVSLHRSSIVAVIGLAGFGAGTVADVVFPMACAPSADARCAAADAAGTLGTTHVVHTISSATALAAACLTAVVLIVIVARATGSQGARRGPARSGHRAMVIVVVAVLVITSSVAVSLLAVLGNADGGLPAGGGVAQRLQTVTIAALLAGAPHWLRTQESNVGRGRR